MQKFIFRIVLLSIVAYLFSDFAVAMQPVGSRRERDESVAPRLATPENSAKQQIEQVPCGTSGWGIKRALDFLLQPKPAPLDLLPTAHAESKLPLLTLRAASKSVYQAVVGEYVRVMDLSWCTDQQIRSILIPNGASTDLLFSIFVGLNTIDFHGSGLTDQTLGDICTKIQELMNDSNPQIRGLMNDPNLSIRALHLSCKVTSAGIVHLRKLKHLRHLYLLWSGICKKDLSPLTELTGLRIRDHYGNTYQMMNNEITVIRESFAVTGGGPSFSKFCEGEI